MTVLDWLKEQAAVLRGRLEARETVERDDLLGVVNLLGDLADRLAAEQEVRSIQTEELQEQVEELQEQVEEPPAEQEQPADPPAQSVEVVLPAPAPQQLEEQPKHKPLWAKILF